MKFVVVHKSRFNENLEVFGPFDKMEDAKSWMAQDFVDALNAVNEITKEKNVYEFWNDEKDGTYANCSFEISNGIFGSKMQVDTWEIGEFFGK